MPTPQIVQQSRKNPASTGGFEDIQPVGNFHARLRPRPPRPGRRSAERSPGWQGLPEVLPSSTNLHEQATPGTPRFLRITQDCRRGRGEGEKRRGIARAQVLRSSPTTLTSRCLRHGPPMPRVVAHQALPSTGTHARYPGVVGVPRDLARPPNRCARVLPRTVVEEAPHPSPRSPPSGPPRSPPAGRCGCGV